MTLDSFDVVFYTCVFLLPGFVISSIIDKTNPPKKNIEFLFFLKDLLFSIVSLGVLCWAYKLVGESNTLSDTKKWVLFVCISLFGSIILGFVFAIIKQKQIINWIFSKLKIKTIHTTPSAWDYYFSKQKESFIIVTLNDDTKLYGWYSCKSFSSSDIEERDLYIEIGYSVDDNNNWTIDEQSEGLYIPKEQIKYIEFKKGATNGQ